MSCLWISANSLKNSWASAPYPNPQFIIVGLLLVVFGYYLFAPLFPNGDEVTAVTGLGMSEWFFPNAFIAGALVYWQTGSIAFDYSLHFVIAWRPLRFQLMIAGVLSWLGEGSL